MNVKTSFFGTTLLIFTIVILFTTQTSEAAGNAPNDCERDPDLCRYNTPPPPPTCDQNPQQDHCTCDDGNWNTCIADDLPECGTGTANGTQYCKRPLGKTRPCTTTYSIRCTSGEQCSNGRCISNTCRKWTDCIANTPECGTGTASGYQTCSDPPRDYSGPFNRSCNMTYNKSCPDGNSCLSDGRCNAPCLNWSSCSHSIPECGSGTAYGTRRCLNPDFSIDVPCYKRYSIGCLLGECARNNTCITQCDNSSECTSPTARCEYGMCVELRGGGSPPPPPGGPTFVPGSNGCAGQWLTPGQTVPCDYCPRCSGPLLNTSYSNCGAKRGTTCYGGSCTEWRGGVNCYNLNPNERWVCSRDGRDAECVCADQTKCKDTGWVNRTHSVKCRSGAGNVNSLSYNEQRACFNGVWQNIHRNDSACSVALQAAGVSDWNKRVKAGERFTLRYSPDNGSSWRRVTRTRSEGSWICPVPPLVVRNRSCSEGIDCSSNTTGYQERLRKYCLTSWNRHACSDANLNLTATRFSGYCPNGNCNLSLSASEDIAACNNASDCVFEHKCYSNLDADTFLRGYSSWSWRGGHSTRHTTGRYYRSLGVEVDNGSAGLEHCNNGLWTRPKGVLRGSIRNTSGDRVQKNFTVTVLGTGLKTSSSYYTQNSPISRLGLWNSYSIRGSRRIYSEYNIREIPVGTYDIIVEDPSGEYETAIVKNVVIRHFLNTTRHILLKRDLGRDCNDDCTDHRGICSPKCHGKGECLFSSPEAMNICEGYFKGYADHRNDTKKRVLCCTGKVFTPVKAEITFCEGLENVAVVKKPVVFRGKFANMVVLAFDANECTNRKNNTE